MRVIVVAAQKGGTGKTTLSSHLGVELNYRGYRTVLVDTDPQGSLSAWWEAREAAEPALLTSTAEELEASLAALSKTFDLVVVDTPPQVSRLIKQVVSLADLVLIPTKASPNDLRAVGATVDLVADSQKEMVFVLNEVRPKIRLEGQAIAVLSQHGRVSPIVYDRQDFVSAMIDGRVAQELNPLGKAAVEISDLCTYVLAQLGLGKRQARKV